MSVIPWINATISGGRENSLSSSRSHAALPVTISKQQAPGDILYYSNISITNIVVGSRYWLALQSDHSQVLAYGVASDTSFTLTNIPGFTNPQLLELRVRYSSSSVKYLPLTIYAYQNRTGGFFYVSQVTDGVAS